MKVNAEINKSDDDGEVFYKASCKRYEAGVYEENGLISSVWYNDSAGRLTQVGKMKKINLYLERYGSLENWEQRASNDWITHFYNDFDGVHMAYGNHMDVIRINKR